MSDLKRLNKKIGNLELHEAISILRTLCKDDNTAKKIDALVTKELKSIQSDDIAKEIFCILDYIDVEDLWAHSGGTRHGYVEPIEMADEMIQDAIDPFLRKMAEYANMKMWKEEKIYCIGIIKGLLLYDRDGSNEFRDWCPDGPTDTVESTLSDWQKTHSAEDVAEIRAFYEEFLRNGKHDI